MGPSSRRQRRVTPLDDPPAPWTPGAWSEPSAGPLELDPRLRTVGELAREAGGRAPGALAPPHAA